MSPTARKVLITVVALGAAMTGFLIASLTQPTAPPNLSANNPKLATAQLLALTLPDPDGNAQAMGQWQGKLLVVNFWATWCPPCREEMPGFSRLQEKYAAKGVQFVGIALDSADKVKKFSVETPVAYPLLIGSSGLFTIVTELGDNAGALPFTVIIGRDGTLLQTRLGIWKEAVLDALLAEQIK